MGSVVVFIYFFIKEKNFDGFFFFATLVGEEEFVR